jgi:hypothetical protein
MPAAGESKSMRRKPKGERFGVVHGLVEGVDLRSTLNGGHHGSKEAGIYATMGYWKRNKRYTSWENIGIGSLLTGENGLEVGRR